MDSDKKTEVKIAYEIMNNVDGNYTISATLMDCNNKVFEQCKLDISINDFNSTISYTEDEKELLSKANELVKLKTTVNIATILEKDIKDVVEKIKSTLN